MENQFTELMKTTEELYKIMDDIIQTLEQNRIERGKLIKDLEAI